MSVVVDLVGVQVANVAAAGVSDKSVDKRDREESVVA